MIPVRLTEIGHESSAKREISVDKEEFLIGRGPDCDLRLGDASISRHHCLVRIRDFEVGLADLGSSNGTYLNGHRILSQAPLHHGDEIRLGVLGFRVEIGDQTGISWYQQSGVDPATTTRKITDFKLQIERKAENERSHPPGEAGGQGDTGGKESGQE